MIKLIIFDLDGTLADTLDDIGDGVNRMLGDFDLPLLTRKDVQANINNGPRELIRRSLPEKYRNDEEFVSKALAVYKGYYNLCYCNKTALYPGVKEALLSLSEKGIKLAVLSNKQDEAVKVIVSSLLPDIPFACVLGQGEFPTKPCPDAVINIMNTVGVSPEETAFVGDSNVDVQTALNSGTYPVGVTWGYRDKDVLLNAGARLLIEKTETLAFVPELIG